MSVGDQGVKFVKLEGKNRKFKVIRFYSANTTAFFI